MSDPLPELAASPHVQGLSKTLFGQAHRLGVMLAIARSDGLVNPGDLAESLGHRAQSAVQSPLRDLESAGLISRSPRVAGKVYYRRNPSLAWAWVEELVSSESPAVPERAIGSAGKREGQPVFEGADRSNTI